MTLSPPGTDPALSAAADLLRQGRLVVIPTETYFGLAADALSARAVASIYQAKGRSATKPLPLIAASRAMAEAFCDLSGVPGCLAAFWPGPLTLVLPARAPFPAPLLDARGCVALRVPGHPAARALSALLGKPLTATSANLQHGEPVTRAGDLVPDLLARTGMVLDLPPAPAGGAPSTILSFPEPGRARLHREGAVSRRRLAQAGLRFTDDPGPSGARKA